MTRPAFPFRVWNTLKGSVVDFEPLDKADAQRENRIPRVRMYVCGPTVYDDAHLGHARCYITWDVLYRFLCFSGYDVIYVRNITDVDDKILARAKERGETPAKLAERNYQSFRADMTALNVHSPTHEPKATDYIAEMQLGIQTLLDKQAAYTTEDGSVYFRVAAKPDYGKLKFTTDEPTNLHQHLDDLKAGARVEMEEGKESPLDFALWKAVDIVDPDGWESPWPNKASGKGWGRPGWHMECSAMNHALFGEQIDIHAGGADLIFPHHENEIAQSEAWTGKKPFSRYWLHNGFVNVSGTKMSKSLGNFSTIKTILNRYSANAIRYFLLTNGYRMPVDFNDEALQSAQKWLETREKSLIHSQKKLGLEAPALESLLIHSVSELQALCEATPTTDILDEFLTLIRWMNDDMNTSQALASLNKVMARLRQETIALPENEPSSASRDVLILTFRCTLSMWCLLGFDLQCILNEKKEINATSVTLPDSAIQQLYGEITGQSASSQSVSLTLLTELLILRKQAKAEKNWSQADAIRQQLGTLDFKIFDHKDGSSALEKDGQEIVRH